MQIKLYTITDDNNVLNKTLGNPTNIDIISKDEMDILNPKIVLNRDKFVEGSNYVYIDKLKRYYFITESSYISNSYIKLECEIDVLMTYKDDILKGSGYVTSTDSKPSDKFIDLGSPVSTKPTVFRYDSDKEVNQSDDKNIILVTIGGVNNE